MRLPRTGTALLALVIVPWLPGAALAELRVEVIPLQHRFARDVIPVVQPLLPPGGTVTGVNDQLVVKTTPENLAEIHAVLAAIDQPLRRLRISVRSDASRAGTAAADALSAHAELGDVNVAAGDGRAGSDGLSVGVEGSDAGVQYQRRDRTSTSDDGATYAVQGVEGQPAFIRTGEAVPVHTRTVYGPRGGRVVQDTVDYYDADSGFWVLPRIAGQTVTLAIAPRSATVSGRRPPSFDMQMAQTTVSGRLGQWIEIGGISAARHATTRDGAGAASTAESSAMSLQVRVEEVP